MEIIKAENITFTYSGRNEAALKNVSFSIESGDFVTLCGKSGSGKSTLLSLLKPETAPFGAFDGSIFIKGKEQGSTDKRTLSRTIGFVGQNPENQMVTDKVWHELAFGLENLGLSGDEIRAKVAETVSFFGIEKWFYSDVFSLSGGQKQLLNLAAVMVMQPDILLLDEPTSRLDPISAKRFFDTVSRINKELSTTVILCEHSLEEAFALSDKVIVLENGEITASGTPAVVGEKIFGAKSSMFYALPAAMRVHFSIPNRFECPITVKDGKKWLADFSENFGTEKKTDKNCIDDFDVKDDALRIKNIWFRYEKNMPDCLKDVSFSVKRGEFFAVLGGNGSGKTTLLSVLSGVKKAYSGKIEFFPEDTGKSVGYLPQNPQVLFTKNTVEEELFDSLEESGLNDDKKRAVVYDSIALCELNDLLNSHPFDISGGEQQRVALAKILIKSPEILLLDEPTKGIDIHFKMKFANILKKLKKLGKTVIMVSHDLEFCAKYADRCALFFDGSILSIARPYDFFAKKQFYTTSANRIARDKIEGAVLDEDIIAACRGKMPDFRDNDDFSCINNFYKDNIKEEKTKEKFKIKKNHIFGFIFLVLLFITDFFCSNVKGAYAKYGVQLAEVVLAAMSFASFFPKRRGECTVKNDVSTKAPEKHLLAVSLWFIIVIPLTVLLGVSFLGNRKYYFISMLVIFEVFAAFIFLFEKKKPKVAELVTISVLCAITISGRAVFYMLPQFKPMLALIIIAGVCFGAETGFFIGSICAFVSNFFFGQGPWTPWQMICFGIIGFLAGVLYERKILKANAASLCIFGLVSAIFIYGLIMNCASVLMYQTQININMIKASIVTGFPFDVVHAASTVFFIWLGGEQLIEKLERIKTKYGIFN